MQFHIFLQGCTLFWDQKWNRTKIKLLRKCSSCSIINTTENLFSSKVFTTWVPIKETFFLAHNLNILVIQTQPKPIQIPSSCCFHKATLLNNKLNCLQLWPTVASIHSKTIFFPPLNSRYFCFRLLTRNYSFISCYLLCLFRFYLCLSYSILLKVYISYVFFFFQTGLLPKVKFSLLHCVKVQQTLIVALSQKLNTIIKRISLNNYFTRLCYLIFSPSAKSSSWRFRGIFLLFVFFAFWSHLNIFPFLPLFHFFDWIFAKISWVYLIFRWRWFLSCLTLLCWLKLVSCVSLDLKSRGLRSRNWSLLQKWRNIGGGSAVVFYLLLRGNLLLVICLV